MNSEQITCGFQVFWYKRYIPVLEFGRHRSHPPLFFDAADGCFEIFPLINIPNRGKFLLRKLRDDLDFARIIIGFHSIADIILNTLPSSQSSCRLYFAIARSCDAMICM